MSSNSRPTVSVVLDDPKTLADVAKWADLAGGLGMAQESPVSLSGINRLTVTAYLSTTTVPGESC